MSADNGLLVKKTGKNKFDIYYLVADNKNFVKTVFSLYDVIVFCQKQQKESFLEYGTRFEGF